MKLESTTDNYRVAAMVFAVVAIAAVRRGASFPRKTDLETRKS